MIGSGGGGKLPNANCDYQMKYPNLPTTNDRFLGGGGKLPKLDM